MTRGISVVDMSCSLFKKGNIILPSIYNTLPSTQPQAQTNEQFRLWRIYCIDITQSSPGSIQPCCHYCENRICIQILIDHCQVPSETVEWSGAVGLPAHVLGLTGHQEHSIPGPSVWDPDALTTVPLRLTDMDSRLLYLMHSGHYYWPIIMSFSYTLYRHIFIICFMYNRSNT